MQEEINRVRLKIATSVENSLTDANYRRPRNRFEHVNMSVLAHKYAVRGSTHRERIIKCIGLLMEHTHWEDYKRKLKKDRTARMKPYVN